MNKYTEAIQRDDVVILCDGIPMGVGEILAALNAAPPPADAALADDALCESLIEASDMRWNGDVYIGDGADLMNLVRAALRARAVPDERVVWQFRDRGGEQWQDAQDEFHAETLRRRSFLLRGVVVVTKVSGDYPPAAMLAASKAAEGK